jgi:hypothetical protein
MSDNMSCGDHHPLAKIDPLPYELLLEWGSFDDVEYLLNAFIQTYVAVSGVFRILAQRGISWEAWSPNFILLVFGIIVQLALVRLVLEVAAIVLASRHSS